MRVRENVLGYSATAAIPSPDYASVMRPLLSGRFFSENDMLSTAQIVVIDEHLAQHAFGGGNPVGKLLWIPAMGNRPVEVIGVVGHVRHWGLAGDDSSRIQDQVYCPLAQVRDGLVRLFSSFLSMVIRTDVPPRTMLPAWQKQARGTGGDRTLYGSRTMEELASASLAQQRFLLLLFGTFSGLALLLACVCIHRVVAYLTNQRVPEFGVRIAVGANSRDILWLVLRDSVAMLFAGIAIGAVGSIATAHLVHGLEPVAQAPLTSTFAMVLPALIGIALLACYIPARRAAKVDPMVALRYE